MNASRLSVQLADLFTYLLVPGLAVITPASFSRWILRKVSGWHWYLADAAEAAFQGTRGFVEVADEEAFKRRWKQVEMLDVRDLYMITCGRSRAVLAEVECDVDVELARDRVTIGMHWGPSISILKLLQTAGLAPAFPYRPPERQILKVRPFYYLFSTLAARYIRKTLGERAVAVGGASKVLRGMMHKPGSVIVLMDAPPMEGRPTLSTEVVGKGATFNAGVPMIIGETEKEYVFYAISLQAGDMVRKKLELEGPFSSHDAQEFIQNYAEFLERHMISDPPQWRIWQAAKQLLK